MLKNKDTEIGLNEKHGMYAVIASVFLILGFFWLDQVYWLISKYPRIDVLNPGGNFVALYSSFLILVSGVLWLVYRVAKFEKNFNKRIIKSIAVFLFIVVDFAIVTGVFFIGIWIHALIVVAIFIKKSPSPVLHLNFLIIGLVLLITLLSTFSPPSAIIEGDFSLDKDYQDRYGSRLIYSGQYTTLTVDIVLLEGDSIQFNQYGDHFASESRIESLGSYQFDINRGSIYLSLVEGGEYARGSYKVVDHSPLFIPRYLYNPWLLFLGILPILIFIVVPIILVGVVKLLLYIKQYYKYKNKLKLTGIIERKMCKNCMQKLDTKDLYCQNCGHKQTST